MAKKKVAAKKKSQPLEKVLRVGDVVDFNFSVQEYGRDSIGAYCIVDVGEPYEGDETPMIVKKIDQDSITLDPSATHDEDSAIRKVELAQMEAAENVAGESVAMQLWSDDEQRQQEQLALSLIKELERIQDLWKEAAAHHRGRVKSIKLQLRALAHGTFPDGERSMFGDDDGATVDLPSKLKDPSELPSPSELGGDELAKRAAEAEA